MSRLIPWWLALVALVLSMAAGAWAAPTGWVSVQDYDNTKFMKQNDSLIVKLDSLIVATHAGSPLVTRMFGKANASAGRDSVLVTDANTIFAMWAGGGTTGPTFYFYGTGIGTASRDSLVGTLLPSAGALLKTFADLDSAKWVVPAAGATVTGWVEGW